MRGLSLLGLLAALLVVGLLVRKQLQPEASQPVAPGAVHTPAQARQVEAQVRESLDKALQARPVPDE